MMVNKYSAEICKRMHGGIKSLSISIYKYYGLPIHDRREL